MKISSIIAILVPRRKETRAAYLFLLPITIGFVVFVVGPLIASVFLSFFHWDLFSTPQFVGLQNYKSLFQDSRFLITLRNTFFYIVGGVSLNLIIALFLALGIQRSFNSILRYFFRTTYFFPVLTSMASVSIIWQFLLHTELGPVNYYLRKIGFSCIPWFTSSEWVIPSIILIMVWKGMGFSMVLFLAGLQNIPRQLYEAATIDGASSRQKFWFITLPLLSPTTFFAIIIALISTVQIFDGPSIITGGGPGDSSRSLVMYIYFHGFRSFHMGYACAIAMVMFLIILILTLSQFKLGQKWVFYK